MSGELKQICQKYEHDIKTLTRDLEEMRERNNEVELLLKEKESLLTDKEQSWMEMETQYKNLVQMAQD